VARLRAVRPRLVSAQTSAAARGTQAGEARRRIAGDQDRLADRLKRLQEQVSGLAATTPAASESRQAVDEAARQLEQERIEARMREAARALRSAGDERTNGERMAAQAAGTSRDLARAMDRVADRLGNASGAPSADDRKLSDQLARTRELREEMNDLQRRMQQLARQAEASAQAEQQRGGRNGRQPTGASRADAAGQQGFPEAGPASQGAQAGSGGNARRELEQLRQQYTDRMREADRLQQQLGGARQSSGGTTPEGQQMVTSAPGTEAFKQDFSRWETLHKDVTLGLERLEASLSKALLERAARERLKAGAADRAPDEYEQAVDAYFRSLAAPKP
jgi:hypothetical protein